MTTRTIIGLAIATVCTGAVPSIASGRQQPTEPAHKTVLLAGCLQPAETKDSYTLRNAAILPQPAASPSTPATAGDTKAAERIEYELRPATGVAESGVDRNRLAQHAGQRVEITARPTDDTAPATPDPKSTAEQPKIRDEGVQKVRLTVTDIKSLGMPCR